MVADCDGVVEDGAVFGCFGGDTVDEVGVRRVRGRVVAKVVLARVRS